MKYLNKYENFIEQDINEDLSALFSSAKGAFKSFLNSFTTPFKNLKDDFKKGLKKEEIKQKINSILDTMLKSATDSINKAEDEFALTNIKDAFDKELTEKMAEFDTEIKTIKESKIYESVIKDSMIRGRVLLGMIKNKAIELKTDYDKKYQVAKDLNDKKTSTIEYIKNIVDQSKKMLLDDKKIEELTNKYMTDNKIVSDTLYKTGDVVIYLRQGKTKEQWDALSDEKKKDITSPETSAIVNSKKIEKIEGDKIIFLDKDGKEFIKSINDIISKVGVNTTGNTDVNKQLTDKLTAIKTDPEKIKKISNFADFINKPENAEKLSEIEKIIGTPTTEI